MRFLILTQYFSPEIGAAQVRLSAFSRELANAGHDVEILTALPNYPTGTLAPGDRWRAHRHETIDGIRVTRFWLYAAKGAGMRRLMSYLSFTVTALVGALTVRRPDVVFVESPPLFLGLTGWVVAKRFGAPLILNVSDLWPDSVRDMGIMLRGPWLNWAEGLERFLYRRATAVTAVTEGIRDRLVTAKGVDPERVLFLPNGTDVAALTTDSPGRDGGGRPRIVYAGTHGLAHGLDVIVEAAELAPDLDFLLVGDGTEKDRLRREIVGRSLSNVELRDPVPPAEVAALYADATAGLSTLRRSEFMVGVRPAKVLSVMAAGRPVLYAGAGEGAALVKDAGAGIVVEPEDPAALVAAARALAADPARAAEMGRNGRRYVEQHFAWPVLVTDWLAQLSRALRSPDR